MAPIRARGKKIFRTISIPHSSLIIENAVSVPIRHRIRLDMAFSQRDSNHTAEHLKMPAECQQAIPCLASLIVPLGCRLLKQHVDASARWWRLS